jgi:hypothetical protein
MMTGEKRGEISVEMKYAELWEGYGLHAASVLKKGDLFITSCMIDFYPI